MQQRVFCENWSDAAGNPAGGVATSRGMTISWQNGQLGRGDERKEPNGAFVEDVIHAAAERIRFYQASKFACDENEEALQYLELALDALRSRTAKREARKVEGTHEK